MKPRPTEVLAFLAKTLPEMAREAGSSYARKQLALAGTLLNMIAQDSDRLGPRLIDEAKAIRAIFDNAKGVVVDRQLADEISAEALLSSTDLHLTALFVENDRLRELLTRLHASVETMDTPEAHALDEAIWAELALQNERRRTSYLKTKPLD